MVHLVWPGHVEEQEDGGELYSSTWLTPAMFVLQDLDSQLIQGGHVDKLTLVLLVVHLLHSVWVALNTAECVAGHWLTGGVITMGFMGTMVTGKILMVHMWMVCLWLMELLVHVSTSGHLLVVGISACGVYNCPCDNGNTYPSPPFVGNDYFCESVVTTRSSHNANGSTFFQNALLWDGQVCEGGGTCCHFNNPPWFTKNLASPTTDSIELWLCTHNGRSSGSDIALELLELYVQWTQFAATTLLMQLC